MNVLRCRGVFGEAQASSAPGFSFLSTFPLCFSSSPKFCLLDSMSTEQTIDSHCRFFLCTAEDLDF